MSEPMRTKACTPSGAGAASGETLEDARAYVLQHLREAVQSFQDEGFPRPALDGKILRPLTAYLTVPASRRSELDLRFWMGLLAVEMVHEASLLHDDILDEAPERRGRPTLVAAAGVGSALVQGDHLLTAAYRAAAATGSCEFLHAFTRSVERTVAGEIAQEQSQGRILAEEEYRKVITNKSGELFGSAFALAPTLLGIGCSGKVAALGTRLGCLYQMADDFLDYCPGADRGKVPLQDYRQRKWTWPLGLVGATGFHASGEEILRRLSLRPKDGGLAPLEEGVILMERELLALTQDLEMEGLETSPLDDLLAAWMRQLREAALNEVERYQPATDHHRDLRASLAMAAEPLAGTKDRLANFGGHAKSFRFAARLFPARVLERVAGVYAFCRFTDDLVDEARGRDAAHLSLMLDEWLGMAREAHSGRRTGVALLDDIIGDMSHSGVPFRYVEELVEGVRMDLFPRRFESLQDLRVYSFRVASVVGGWITELFGVRERWVLERAFALGHAMQLTNILRDVGEDLEMGRLYLPDDRMARHGIDRPLLEAMAQSPGPVLPEYKALLEELMAEAEADYERAFRAIPALPGFLQGPVAIAARVYRGIHAEIRRQGHDNLKRRARTSSFRKVSLGAGALLSLWALRRESRGRYRAESSAASAPEPGESQEAMA